MDQRTQAQLQAVLVDASTVAEHAERLRAQAEDHASVLPDGFMQSLGVLVNEISDLRDDIHDIHLDPNDHVAQ